MRVAHRRVCVGEWVHPSVDEFYDGSEWVSVSAPGRLDIERKSPSGIVRRGWCPMRRPIKVKRGKG